MVIDVSSLELKKTVQQGDELSKPHITSGTIMHQGQRWPR